MKINDQAGIGGPNRPGDLQGVRGVATGQREKSDGGGQQGDKVSVSEDARRLSRLKQEIGNVDAVRTEKVEALREQIQRGEYEVDLKSVAKKLLESIFGG